MTPRWHLLDTWEIGAVQICVGEKSHVESATIVVEPVMRWAKLQWRTERRISVDRDDPPSGRIVTSDWQDVPLE